MKITKIYISKYLKKKKKKKRENVRKFEIGKERTKARKHGWRRM